MDFFEMLRYLFLAVVVLIGVLIAVFIRNPDLPKLNPRPWWGKGDKRQEEDNVEPFEIKFEDSMIEDLKTRLKKRRPFTKPLEGINSEYGFNTDFLEDIVDHWLTRYDFKERAARMNRFPRYTTMLQGLNIRFIHVKPKIDPALDMEVIPILLMHGWPSSSYEFQKIIPILTTPEVGRDYVFEVVAPDLPGFGFSEATSKPGMDSIQAGLLMRNLMRRLGHKRFYIHAGDWGSQAATHLATLYPDDVLGLHISMAWSITMKSLLKLVVGAVFPSIVAEKHERIERLYPLTNTFWFIMKEFGYYHIQATKPDTVGVGLTDSPAGLAAYMLEKISMCTFHQDRLHHLDGGLMEAYETDELLDVVMIVWANSCITTSMRMYAESSAYLRAPELRILSRIPTPTPTAVIKFRYEVLYQPDSLLRDKFPNLVQSTSFDIGGHFAGLQHPGPLAADILDAAVAFRHYHAART